MNHNWQPQFVPVPHCHSGGREPLRERGEPQQGLRFVLLGISNGQPAAYATLPRPLRALRHPCLPQTPRSLQEQLATLTLQAGITEATAWIVAAEQDAALGRQKTAEYLLATADMNDALAWHSRLPSPTLSLTGQHPSQPPSCLTATSDLARVMQALEDRHQADCRAAMEREERAELQV
jgi:hypothetical protein